ncbi:MAG: caspase family protein, partial [Pirellulaceae bacterium]
MKTFYVLLVLSLTSFSCYADEIPMYALVIGNGGYPEGKLKNPGNDAKLMAETLEPLGFKVTIKTDLDQQQMDQAVSEFAGMLPRGSVALFFYAGHGVQDKNKRNYLIPIGAKLQNEASIRYRTLSLDFVIDALEQSKSNLNIVVLDCCRDNPFERSWTRSLDARGLAVIEAPEGTIIAHSTASGETAEDGAGANSVYTTQLAKSFKQGSAERTPLVSIFRQASRAVLEETRQRPFLEFDATMPEFHLPGGAPAIIAPTNSSQKGDANSGTPSPHPVPMLPSETSAVSSNKTTPPPTPVDNSLLQQAALFATHGEHELAIEAYAALIANSDLPPSVRIEARRGRGAAYLARRSDTNDINHALIDHKAAGGKGVHLSVLVDQTQLMNGTTAAGNVGRNEIVFITDSRGKWSLVESVGGDTRRRGWIDLSALLESQPAVTPTQPMPPVSEDKSLEGGLPGNDPDMVVPTPSQSELEQPQDAPDAELQALIAALPRDQLRLGVIVDATLSGAEVIGIVPDSPATNCVRVDSSANAQKGRFALRRSDLIVAINGTPVRDAAEAMTIIATSPKQIRIKLIRDSGLP